MFNISKITVAIVTATAPILAEVGEAAHRARRWYDEVNARRADMLRTSAIRTAGVNPTPAELAEIDAVATASMDDDEPPVVVCTGTRLGGALVLWPTSRMTLASVILVPREGHAWATAHHEWQHHYRGDVPRVVNGLVDLVTWQVIRAAIINAVPSIRRWNESEVNIAALAAMNAELNEEEARAGARLLRRPFSAGALRAFDASVNECRWARIDGASDLARAQGTYIRAEGRALMRVVSRVHMEVAVLSRWAAEYEIARQLTRRFNEAAGLLPEDELTPESFVHHSGKPSDAVMALARG